MARDPLGLDLIFNHRVSERRDVTGMSHSPRVRELMAESTEELGRQMSGQLETYLGIRTEWRDGDGREIGRLTLVEDDSLRAAARSAVWNRAFGNAAAGDEEATSRAQAAVEVFDRVRQFYVDTLQPGGDEEQTVIVSSRLSGSTAHNNGFTWDDGLYFLNPLAFTRGTYSGDAQQAMGLMFLYLHEYDHDTSNITWALPDTVQATLGVGCFSAAIGCPSRPLFGEGRGSATEEGAAMGDVNTIRSILGVPTRDNYEFNRSGEVGFSTPDGSSAGAYSPPSAARMELRDAPLYDPP